MSFGSGILWSGTRHRQGFWPRINCSQMKLPNFGSPSSDSSSKIGRHFSNKVVLKLKSAKNAFYKKVAPKLIFFNEIFFRKIRMIFDIENSLWKSKIGTFWQTVTKWTQNLVISFDFSWFLAKNLAYAECPIIKFHYRNSSSVKPTLFLTFPTCF